MFSRITEFDQIPLDLHIRSKQTSVICDIQIGLHFILKINGYTMSLILSRMPRMIKQS